MRTILLIVAVFMAALALWRVGGLAAPPPSTAQVRLVRVHDGRCWRAHGKVEHDGDALTWRTDGGLRMRVRGADWIEVARGDGANAGLDWRHAAATLGVDLGRCLPVAETAP